MARFAKLFEVDGEQVLFYLEPDAEGKPTPECDDFYKVNQVTHFDGIYANVAVAGMPYENAENMLSKTDEAYANAHLQMVRNLLATPTDQEAEETS